MKILFSVVLVGLAEFQACTGEYINEHERDENKRKAEVGQLPERPTASHQTSQGQPCFNSCKAGRYLADIN